MKLQHFSPNFHEFTGSKTIFAKKKIVFLAQKLEIYFWSKSVSGYYKTKKRGMDHYAISVGRVKP